MPFKRYSVAVTPLLLFAILWTLCGCSDVSNSAGKVLGNMGSVIETGSNKMWGKSSPSAPVTKKKTTKKPSSYGDVPPSEATK